MPGSVVGGYIWRGKDGTGPATVAQPYHVINTIIMGPACCCCCCLGLSHRRLAGRQARPGSIPCHTQTCDLDPSKPTINSPTTMYIYFTSRGNPLLWPKLILGEGILPSDLRSIAFLQERVTFDLCAFNQEASTCLSLPGPTDTGSYFTGNQTQFLW